MDLMINEQGEENDKNGITEIRVGNDSYGQPKNDFSHFGLLSVWFTELIGFSEPCFEPLTVTLVEHFQ